MEDVRMRPLEMLKASFIALFASVILCIGGAFVLAPEKAHAADGTHIATIEVEGYGTITAELDRNAAPTTVDNFVKLAQSGFYNGLTFHRVSKDFCIQGGDPKGDGTGGSSTKIKGEFSANGFYNPIKHVAGTLSMARGSDYSSASSQFFIVTATNSSNTNSLDGKYAAFGHVTSGMDVVNKLNNVAVIGGSGSNKEKPKSTIKIKSIVVKTVPSSGKWVKSGSRYWYKYDTQTAKAKGKAYPRNEEFSINGKTYRFDSAGWMKTGWQKVDDKWYYYGGKRDGAKKIGWQKVSGKWYYLDPTTAVMKTGRLDLRSYAWDSATSSIVNRGDVYYLSSSGAMKTGWNKENGKWYYYKSSGAMAMSLLTWIKNGYYLLGHDGAMITGLYDVNKDKCYFDKSSGKMKTGWVKDSGKWYYFNNWGIMQKSKWVGNYYVGSDGVMATNTWIGKYHVNSSGKWDATRKSAPTTKSTTSTSATKSATSSQSSSSAASSAQSESSTNGTTGSSAAASTNEGATTESLSAQAESADAAEGGSSGE